MKKILLISDTHGHLDPALKAHVEAADEVWHAGDLGEEFPLDTFLKGKEFKAVYGNIDGTALRQQFPEELFFTCETLPVYITHIGGYPGKYPAKIKARLKDLKPGLFICGHSHILKVMYDQTLGLLHLNPGACGVQGFHQVKTALRFEVHAQELKNMAVIELGKRNSITTHE